jgi:hypothetical protein
MLLTTNKLMIHKKKKTNETQQTMSYYTLVFYLQLLHMFTHNAN